MSARTKRPVLMVAAGLALFTAMVVWRPGMPAGRELSTAPFVTRDLHFADRADGSIKVSDAATGAEIALVAPGSNAFLRGALRALVRDRRKEDLGPETPFRVAAWPDGRRTLEDPATGRQVALDAFGPTNAAAFARLLTARETTP